MDPGRAEKYREIGYEIAECCGTCKHFESVTVKTESFSGEATSVTNTQCGLHTYSLPPLYPPSGRRQHKAPLPVHPTSKCRKDWERR